jgi:signal transduction histidine kinase
MEISTKLETIDHQVAHMNSLLNDVLVLAKSDAGKIKIKWARINLTDLIVMLIEEVTISTRKSHTIHYTSDSRLDEIISDEYLLRNIILNLVTNAIKYSPQSSRIDLDLRLMENTLQVRVRDTGLGISASDQQHLFESFFRGKNISTISGTGLGLSIVKRAVDLLGGTITVQSQPGVGSEFMVVLPLVHDENLINA